VLGQEALQGLLRGGQGENQVGAGVAVGDRVDVQLVDLVLVGTECLQPATAPAVDGSGVQGLQHAKIVLTTPDNLSGPQVSGGDWLLGRGIG
jgi:hypothetical protein